MPLDGSPRSSNEHITELKERYDGLANSTERTNCNSHWQEIAEVMSPRKIDFVGMRTPGEKRMARILDSTGVHATELLAAGLHGMATNPASKWFSLRMVTQKVHLADGKAIDLNEDQQVQAYLSDVEAIMWERIYQPGTNFTTALHEIYVDLAAFGTAVMFVGQRDDGGLLFESRSLAECVVAENADGKIDTVFRRTSYTVRQMMQMERRGWEVSDAVRKKFADRKYDDPVVVIHAVYPRDEREYGKKDTKNMPFASCYFEHEACHQLSMSGYPEFPYLVARWSKYATELYGRGPGMMALPDVKMLQACMKTYIKTAEKNADPPMWLHDDGQLGNQRIVPGGVNYLRGNPSERVMLMPTSVQGLAALDQMMEQVRNRIRNTFFVDIMQMVTDRDMTATEVMQRTSERMRLLGPLIGRLESELLGPLVERVFGILEREQKLPPVPPQITKEVNEFTVEYVSPIATAQKQQAVNGIMQSLQLFTPLGPEVAAQVVAKNVDVDRMFRWSWDLFNNDPDLLKDAKALEEDNAKLKMAQQVQQMAPMADIAKQGAGALREGAQAAQSAQGAGLDLQSLLRQFGQNVSGSPQAQAELANAVDEMSGALN
jgi:hypothetical protein